MITIRLNEIGTEYEANDFFKSIKAQASSEDAYEITRAGDTPSKNSRIEITLPNNCLVLHKDWDKYINYNLDNDKSVDEDYVKRRLGLVSRPDNGIFPGLEIKLNTPQSE